MINEILNDSQLIGKVMADLMRVTKYMNVGIMIALAYGAVYLLYFIICGILNRKRRLSTGHAAAVFALLIYVTSLLYIVFMSREPGQYEGYNLKLWSSWGRSTLRKAMFIENIIMFLPMGVLLPAAFRKLRNPMICILTCGILSCFIESVQYVFRLGIAEIDDVVTNTLGGAIGWLIWGIFYLICRVFGKDFKENQES